MLLLGLDVSTKIAGFSIWDKETKELLYLDKFLFNTELTLIERALEFKNFATELLLKWSLIDEMVIEESFTKFSTSDDKTIAMLNQINALIQYVLYEKGIKINTISVQDSRKGAFPYYHLKTKARSGGLSQKEQIFELVVAELGEDRFPKKIMKSGKNKGDERFEDFAFDMADSWVVGKGFLNKDLIPAKKPKAKKKPFKPFHYKGF